MAFRCSKCHEECMNIEYPRKCLFDIELEGEDEIIDVKNKCNSNDDDDSNVFNLNKNGEEVEETILDDTDNTTSNNNEDVKDDKEYNIIEEYNVTPKISISSVVYEAPFEDKYECI